MFYKTNKALSRLTGLLLVKMKMIIHFSIRDVGIIFQFVRYVFLKSPY